MAKTEALKRNFSGDTGVSVENLRLKYIKDKEKMAGLARRNEHEVLNLGEGPLTREQEMSLNDYLFEELVKKENDTYLNALKEARGERWVNKVWEGAKSLLLSCRSHDRTAVSGPRTNIRCGSVCCHCI